LGVMADMGSMTATRQDTEFLEWLAEWRRGLPTATLEDPAATAVVVVDMVNGFCKTGNLASDRVGALIPPVVRVLEDAARAGVTRVLVAEDTHRPNDREFKAFPPHCIAGSGEEKTVDEIMAVSSASKFEVFPKPTVNISIGTGMDERLAQMLDEGVNTFVVIGDCTDLCVYQAATFLRLAANQKDRDARIIVPATAVDTYDMSLETARSVGALPHPAELLHEVFLYHMAILGCEVVADVAWRRSG
ncbi:MAG: isochorismatase family protein, partial [Chloroflexota bacterium]|nr:isochorismatase family protein [Chloroflexota bacterium]